MLARNRRLALTAKIKCSFEESIAKLKGGECRSYMHSHVIDDWSMSKNIYDIIKCKLF